MALKALSGKSDMIDSKFNKNREKKRGNRSEGKRK